MIEQISNDLNYDGLNVLNYNGFYKFLDVQPKVPTTSTTLSLAGTSTIDFEIPSESVFNFSKSYLEFQLEQKIPINKYGKLHVGNCASMFQAIKLTDFQGNTPIIDISNAGNVFKPLARCLPKEKVLAQTTQRLLDPVADSATSLALTGNKPINMVCFADNVSAFSLPALPATGTSSGAIETSSDTWSDKIAEYISTSQALTTNLTVCYRIKINFDNFLGTILCLDKNLYFGKRLKLSLTFAPATRYLFTGDAAVLASSDVVQVTNPPVIQDSSMIIKLATQGDPVIEQKVINIFQKGVDLIIPYISASQHTGLTAGASNQIVTRDLTYSEGTNLKRMIIAPVATSSTGNNSYNMNNSGSLLYENMQTLLQGKELQVNPMYVSNNDDYLLFEDLMEGCAFNEYGHAYCSFVIVDFCQQKTKEWNHTDFSLGGLMLQKDQRFQVKLKTGASCTSLYLIAITNRLMRIESSNNGMIVKIV